MSRHVGFSVGRKLLSIAVLEDHASATPGHVAWQPGGPAAFRDTDGVTRPLLAQLDGHGITRSHVVRYQAAAALHSTSGDLKVLPLLAPAADMPPSVRRLSLFDLDATAVGQDVLEAVLLDYLCGLLANFEETTGHALLPCDSVTLAFGSGGAAFIRAACTAATVAFNAPVRAIWTLGAVSAWMTTSAAGVVALTRGRVATVQSSFGRRQISVDRDRNLVMRSPLHFDASALPGPLLEISAKAGDIHGVSALGAALAGLACQRFGFGGLVDRAVAGFGVLSGRKRDVVAMHAIDPAGGTGQQLHALAVRPAKAQRTVLEVVAQLETQTYVSSLGSFVRSRPAAGKKPPAAPLAVEYDAASGSGMVRLIGPPNADGTPKDEAAPFFFPPESAATFRPSAAGAVPPPMAPQMRERLTEAFSPLPRVPPLAWDADAGPPSACLALPSPPAPPHGRAVLRVLQFGGRTRPLRLYTKPACEAVTQHTDETPGGYKLHTFGFDLGDSGVDWTLRAMPLRSEAATSESGPHRVGRIALARPLIVEASLGFARGATALHPQPLGASADAPQSFEVSATGMAASGTATTVEQGTLVLANRSATAVLIAIEPSVTVRCRCDAVTVPANSSVFVAVERRHALTVTGPEMAALPSVGIRVFAADNIAATPLTQTVVAQMEDVTTPRLLGVRPPVSWKVKPTRDSRFKLPLLATGRGTLSATISTTDGGPLRRCDVEAWVDNASGTAAVEAAVGIDPAVLFEWTASPPPVTQGRLRVQQPLGVGDVHYDFDFHAELELPLVMELAATLDGSSLDSQVLPVTVMTRRAIRQLKPPKWAWKSDAPPLAVRTRWDAPADPAGRPASVTRRLPEPPQPLSTGLAMRKAGLRIEAVDPTGWEDYVGVGELSFLDDQGEVFDRVTTHVRWVPNRVSVAVAYDTASPATAEYERKLSLTVTNHNPRQALKLVAPPIGEVVARCMGVVVARATTHWDWPPHADVPAAGSVSLSGTFKPMTFLGRFGMSLPGLRYHTKAQLVVADAKNHDHTWTVSYPEPAADAQGTPRRGRNQSA